MNTFRRKSLILGFIKEMQQMGRIKVYFLLILIQLLFLKLDTKAQEVDSLTIVNSEEYTSLNEALKDPDNVYKLNLRKQKLKEFPMGILKLKNLRELNLNKNKIKIIPEEIYKLKNLRYLNLARNKITSIPVEFFKLVNLKVLIINENDIEVIPPQIDRLQNLEILDLWGNNLSVFPDELANMKNLKLLDLRVISLNDDAQERISNMLPNTKIHFSPSCNCK